MKDYGTDSHERVDKVLAEILGDPVGIMAEGDDQEKTDGKNQKDVCMGGVKVKNDWLLQIQHGETIWEIQEGGKDFLIAFRRGS